MVSFIYVISPYIGYHSPRNIGVLSFVLAQCFSVRIKSLIILISCRWGAIANMAGFAQAVAGTKVENWQSVDGCGTFSRGNKGFFAICK